MGNITQQVKQIHLLVNGQTLYGEADEVSTPDVALLTEDVRPNTDGIVEVEVGMDKLDFEIKVRGIHRTVAAAFGTGVPNTRIELRAALETYDGEVEPATWIGVGLAKMYNNDPLQGKSELAMSTLAVNCNFYEHHIDGQEIHHIDVLNNVRRIDGEDRLAEIRDAIGA